MKKHQSSLQDAALQNVINATIQQRKSFDDFLTNDQEQLHSYADYLTQHDHGTPEELQEMLTLFRGLDEG